MSKLTTLTGSGAAIAIGGIIAGCSGAVEGTKRRLKKKGKIDYTPGCCAVNPGPDTILTLPNF